MKRVGIIINFNPRDWLGGYNYIYNLIFFLKKYKIKLIKPVIITNNRKNFVKPYNFKNIEILETKVVSKNNSLKRIFYKILIIIFGKNIFLDNFLIKNKIDAISHFEFTGRKSAIKSYTWFADFQEIHLPENFSFRGRILRALNLYLAYRNSTGLIISSKSVFKDLKKINEKYTQKAILLKHATNINKIVSYSKSEKILKKYGIKKNFFYLPNHFWKHKNHLTVLKALKYLKKKNDKFIVVSSGNFNDHRDYNHRNFLKKYIKENSLEDVFQYIGIVPFDDLVALMLRSVAVINPSKSEGLSNTVEQAKALGKKVLLSNIPVHLEQKNSNFYFFKSESHKDLAKLLVNQCKNFKKNRSFSGNIKFYKNYCKQQKIFIKNFEKIFFSS